MKSYTKVPETDEALATKLIDRGLIVDRPTILDALKAVGYFRLTGYLHPFKIPGSDNYRPGTTFERLWSIYTFDRKLRLMAIICTSWSESERRFHMRSRTFWKSDAFGI